MSPSSASTGSARWQPTGLVTTLLSPGARQVVRCWLVAEDYLDEHHHPRMLLSSPDAPSPFADMVHCANPNLVPAVVLGELLRKGIVESLDSGHILLRRSAYAPAGKADTADPSAEPETPISERIPRRRFNDI